LESIKLLEGRIQKRDKPEEDYTKQLRGCGDAKKREIGRGVRVVRD
jgi:hypothetical protein